MDSKARAKATKGKATKEQSTNPLKIDVATLLEQFITCYLSIVIHLPSFAFFVTFTVSAAVTSFYCNYQTIASKEAKSAPHAIVSFIGRPAVVYRHKHVARTSESHRNSGTNISIIQWFTRGLATALFAAWLWREQGLSSESLGCMIECYGDRTPANSNMGNQFLKWAARTLVHWGLVSRCPEVVVAAVAAVVQAQATWFKWW